MGTSLTIRQCCDLHEGQQEGSRRLGSCVQLAPAQVVVGQPWESVQVFAEVSGCLRFLGPAVPLQPLPLLSSSTLPVRAKASVPRPGCLR